MATSASSSLTSTTGASASTVSSSIPTSSHSRPSTPACRTRISACQGQSASPFFGLHPINIRDAPGPERLPPAPPGTSPCPKAPLTPSAAPTELALSGTWHDVNSNELAVFDCLETDVDYNVAEPGRVPRHRHRRARLPALGPARHHGRDPRQRHRHPYQLDGHPRHRRRLVRSPRRPGPDRRMRPHRGPDTRPHHALRDSRAECGRRLDLRPEGGLRDRDRHRRHTDHVRFLRVGRHAAFRCARRPRSLGDRAPAVRLRDGLCRGRAVRPHRLRRGGCRACPARVSSPGTSARPCSTCKVV